MNGENRGIKLLVFLKVCTREANFKDNVLGFTKIITNFQNDFPCQQQKLYSDSWLITLHNWRLLYSSYEICSLYNNNLKIFNF